MRQVQLRHIPQGTFSNFYRVAPYTGYNAERSIAPATIATHLSSVFSTKPHPDGGIWLIWTAPDGRQLFVRFTNGTLIGTDSQVRRVKQLLKLRIHGWLYIDRPDVVDEIIVTAMAQVGWDSPIGESIRRWEAANEAYQHETGER